MKVRSKTPFSPSDVIGTECRFAQCIVADDKSGNDLTLVKLQKHVKGGAVIPTIELIENYKRPFWITVPGCRNHNDKKERESLDKLREYSSTQTNLPRAIAKALGTPWMKGGLREMHNSPYTYGSDISSTALIKQKYAQEFATTNKPATDYTNAVFDTETNMLDGTGDVIMGTVTCKQRVVQRIDKKFLAGHADAINRIKKLADHYIGDILAERNIELDIKLVDDDFQIVKENMEAAHQIMPDFLSVWNLPFDFEKLEDACKKKKIDPAEILCDPSVKAPYRKYRYKKGPAKKVTSSGKVMPYKPAQRWHSVFVPSSFYWIDAMCAYRHIRQGGAEEASYSLDAILDKEFEGKLSKLKFKEADHIKSGSAAWHKFMQKNYPLEYCVYNIFDCICMELLDEKTLDLKITLGMFCGSSDFSNFNSQPRRAVDDLHEFLLKDNTVIGTTSGQMSDDFDEETQSLTGWIVMLDSHPVRKSKLQIIKEYLEALTTIYIHVFDLDVSASYPNGGLVFNECKETTWRELITVVGVEEIERRMQTINLSGGHTNAIEVGSRLFGLPTLDKLLEQFMREI